MQYRSIISSEFDILVSYEMCMPDLSRTPGVNHILVRALMIIIIWIYNAIQINDHYH